MKTVKHMMDEQLKDLIKESDQLKSRLDSLCILCEGKSRIFVDKEKLEQLFEQADFIARELVSLNSANEILYKNRGKASPKKAVSSKVNGKFGGRPPKEISAKKKRIQQLDDKAFIEQRALTDEERKEYDELSMDITAWECSKKMKINESLETD